MKPSVPYTAAEAERAARESTRIWQDYSAREDADAELSAALSKLDEAAREVAFIIGAIVKQRIADRHG